MYRIEQEMKQVEYEEDIYDDKNEKSAAFLKKEAAAKYKELSDLVNSSKDEVELW